MTLSISQRLAIMAGSSPASRSALVLVSAQDGATHQHSFGGSEATRALLRQVHVAGGARFPGAWESSRFEAGTCSGFHGYRTAWGGQSPVSGPRPDGGVIASWEMPHEINVSRVNAGLHKQRDSRERPASRYCGPNGKRGQQLRDSRERPANISSLIAWPVGVIGTPSGDPASERATWGWRYPGRSRGFDSRKPL